MTSLKKDHFKSFLGNQGHAVAECTNGCDLKERVLYIIFRVTLHFLEGCC